MISGIPCNKLKDAEAKYNNDLWTLTDHVIIT
jgi:hypothetical protein